MMLICRSSQQQKKQTASREGGDADDQPHQGVTTINTPPPGVIPCNCTCLFAAPLYPAFTLKPSLPTARNVCEVTLKLIYVLQCRKRNKRSIYILPIVSCLSLWSKMRRKVLVGLTYKFRSSPFFSLPPKLAPFRGSSKPETRRSTSNRELQVAPQHRLLLLYTTTTTGLD